VRLLDSGAIQKVGGGDNLQIGIVDEYKDPAYEMKMIST